MINPLGLRPLPLKQGENNKKLTERNFFREFFYYELCIMHYALNRHFVFVEYLMSGEGEGEEDRDER